MRKKKTNPIQHFFLFFPPTCKKNYDILFKKWMNHMESVYFHNKKLTFEHLFYFLLRCEPNRIFYFLFFILRRGQKDPCRTSSTKQYTECRLRQASFWVHDVSSSSHISVINIHGLRRDKHGKHCCWTLLQKACKIRWSIHSNLYKVAH